MSRSKIVAIVTGCISVLICVLYLLLITVFDFRSFFNEYVTNLSQYVAIFLIEFDYHP